MVRFQPTFLKSLFLWLLNLRVHWYRTSTDKVFMFTSSEIIKFFCQQTWGSPKLSIHWPAGGIVGLCPPSRHCHWVPTSKRGAHLFFLMLCCALIAQLRLTVAFYSRSFTPLENYTAREWSSNMDGEERHDKCDKFIPEQTNTPPELFVKCLLCEHTTRCNFTNL